MSTMQPNSRPKRVSPRAAKILLAMVSGAAFLIVCLLPFGHLWLPTSALVSIDRRLVPSYWEDEIARRLRQPALPIRDALHFRKLQLLRLVESTRMHLADDGESCALVIRSDLDLIGPYPCVLEVLALDGVPLSPVVSASLDQWITQMVLPNRDPMVIGLSTSWRPDGATHVKVKFRCRIDVQSPDFRRWTPPDDPIAEVVEFSGTLRIISK